MNEKNNTKVESFDLDHTKVKAPYVRKCSVYTGEKGDIITKLEETKVGTVAKLRYELYKHTPGDKIDVTYNRDGKEYTTQIKLEETK